MSISGLQTFPRHPSMTTSLHLRLFQPGDEQTLMALFRETVHRVNGRDYSPAQLQAWAPDHLDPSRWQGFAERYTLIAECAHQVVGFTDVENTGHIDRFFVHADFQRRGIGAALMTGILQEALKQGWPRVFAEVSVTARAFFETFGFVVLAEQEVTVRGVTLKNFRMERVLSATS